MSILLLALDSISWVYDGFMSSPHLATRKRTFSNAPFMMLLIMEENKQSTGGMVSTIPRRTSVHSCGYFLGQTGLSLFGYYRMRYIPLQSYPALGFLDSVIQTLLNVPSTNTTKAARVYYLHCSNRSFSVASEVGMLRLGEGLSLHKRP